MHTKSVQPPYFPEAFVSMNKLIEQENISIIQVLTNCGLVSEKKLSGVHDLIIPNSHPPGENKKKILKGKTGEKKWLKHL